jgi:hypothetical protein
VIEAAATTYDELAKRARELDSRASRVQGDLELLVDGDFVEELVDDYNTWFATVTAMLPTELVDKFRDLYEGGVFVKRIKSFLEYLAQ